MPGKYSHSVVLANYSTRGIVDLPPEQHTNYLKSSPYADPQQSKDSSQSWSQIYPNPAQRAQAALAYAARYTSTNEGSPVSRRQFIVDHGTTGGYEAYPQQAPAPIVTSSDGPVVLTPLQDRPRASTPLERTRYVPPSTPSRPRRQSLGDLHHGSSPSDSDKSDKIKAVDFLREVPNPTPSVMTVPPNNVPKRTSSAEPRIKLKSAIKMKGKAKRPPVRSQSQPPVQSYREERDDMQQQQQQQSQQPRQQTRQQQQQQQQQPQQPQQQTRQHHVQQRPPQQSPQQPQQQRQQQQRKQLPQQQQKQPPPPQPQQQQQRQRQPPEMLQRQVSQDTQIHDPRVSAAEPDFDGFSDSGEQRRSYFENAAASKPTIHNQITTHPNQPLNQAETDSPRAASMKAAASGADTSRSMSVETSGTERPTEAVTGVPGSRGKLDSHAPASTVGSQGTPAASSTENPTVTTSGTAQTKPQAQARGWDLPEINEGGGFNPEIFLQNSENAALEGNRNEGVENFADRPLGTVSAGRDVNFSRDDDSVSDMDAAVVPNIERFRDENGSPRSKHRNNKRSDILSGKGAIPPSNNAKPRKSGGFFSRFRSKSTTRT